MRRLWTIVLTVMVLGTIGLRAASAHANLERSNPPANAVLMRAPDVIALWFTEPLEPDFSGIVLRDASGAVVSTPHSMVNPDDPYQMTLAPGSLPDGLYTVSWRSLSSADGHAAQGSFVFTIGAAPDSSAAFVSAADTFSSEGALIRWLDFVSMALVTGGVGFWLFVWLPCQFGAQPNAETRMTRLIALGWLMLGVSGALVLMHQVSVAAYVPLLHAFSSAALGQFVTTTRFGLLWLGRLVLWVALGAALLRARHDTRLLWLALLISGALLATRSLYSHASVAPDVHAAVAGDWLHLLMSTLWVGGLIQFMNVIGLSRGVTSGEVSASSALVSHFSNYARVAVAALAVTGLYAAWLQVGTFEALLTTLYGQALLVKLVLFVPLLAVAAVNLVFTHRGLRAGNITWAHRLRGLVGAEIALVIGVLVATAVMTSSNPARAVLAVRESVPPAPVSTAFFKMEMVDDLHVHLNVYPGTVGENTFTVDIYDEENNHVTDASLIRLRFESETQNLGESELRPTLQPDGTYQITGANLSVPGEWRVRVSIQRPGEFDTVVDFEPTVSPPAAPPAPEATAAAVPALPDRTWALLVTGLVVLAFGGFFAGRSRAPLWRGVGVLASSMVIVGLVFVVSGVMAAG